MINTITTGHIKAKYSFLSPLIGTLYLLLLLLFLLPLWVELSFEGGWRGQSRSWETVSKTWLVYFTSASDCKTAHFSYNEVRRGLCFFFSSLFSSLANWYLLFFILQCASAYVRHTCIQLLYIALLKLSLPKLWHIKWVITFSVNNTAQWNIDNSPGDCF